MTGTRSPRVVVGVTGSLSSLAALRRAAEAARRRDVELWAVAVVVPSARAVALPELRDGLIREARALVPRSLDEAFGSRPAGLRIRSAVGEGSPGRLLVADVADGDLLVLGAGDHRGRWWRGRNPVARYCVRHAPCPVLLVPPPRLAREVARNGGPNWRALERGLAAERRRTVPPG